jgi:hypothetical protein
MDGVFRRYVFGQGYDGTRHPGRHLIETRGRKRGFQRIPFRRDNFLSRLYQAKAPAMTESDTKVAYSLRIRQEWFQSGDQGI